MANPWPTKQKETDAYERSGERAEGSPIKALAPVWALLLFLALCATPARADGPYSQHQVRAWAIEYADYYGVNRNILLGTMSCESHFRWNAYSAGNVGPAQFNVDGIWYSYLNPYRLTNRVTDVEANVAAMAYLFALGRGPLDWPSTYGRDCRGFDGY